MIDWAELMGGGLLLYFGAEWFVSGASALALALRLPQLIVGLTVVAYGTSAPEVIVGVQAARAGHGAVALGNVIGSNIANIGLILGVAVLIAPARVPALVRRRELPVLFLSLLALPLALLDGALSRLEAWLLVLGAVAYTGWMVQGARSGAALAESARGAALEAELSGALGAPRPVSSKRAAFTAGLGLLVLLLGGELFITGAVSVASTLGISERLVGLSIVAIGTSLPELVTSVVAARRGHTDLVVGNVVGSNIFNVLLCLGAAGLCGPVRAPWATLRPELAMLALLTTLAILFMRTARTISRVEGTLLLGLYAVFMTLAVARG